MLQENLGICIDVEAAAASFHFRTTYCDTFPLGVVLFRIIFFKYFLISEPLTWLQCARLGRSDLTLLIRIQVVFIGESHIYRNTLTLMKVIARLTTDWNWWLSENWSKVLKISGNGTKKRQKRLDGEATARGEAIQLRIREWGGPRRASWSCSPWNWKSRAKWEALHWVPEKPARLWGVLQGESPRRSWRAGQTLLPTTSRGVSSSIPPSPTSRGITPSVSSSSTWWVPRSKVEIPGLAWFWLRHTYLWLCSFQLDFFLLTGLEPHGIGKPLLCSYRSKNYRYALCPGCVLNIFFGGLKDIYFISKK